MLDAAVCDLAYLLDVGFDEIGEVIVVGMAACPLLAALFAARLLFITEGGLQIGEAKVAAAGIITFAIINLLFLVILIADLRIQGF